MSEHFVATYVKVGTFQIVDGNKVGGNVASYFCLSDGSVLHAIPGPVDAKTFLSEARWAVETRKAASTFGTNLAKGTANPLLQTAYISAAHEERYLSEPHNPWLGDQVGQANPVLARPLTRQAMIRNLSLLPPRLPQATSTQAQVDWLLAVHPLPPLNRIYPLVWEQILHEKLPSLPVAQH
jgi:hypothetical protein